MAPTDRLSVTTPRRRLLALGATLVTTGLAGCSADQDDTDESDAGDPSGDDTEETGDQTAAGDDPDSTDGDTGESEDDTQGTDDEAGDDEPARTVPLLIEGDEDVELHFEPANQHMDWLVADKAGTPTIVFDPEGQPRYNTQAVTTWNDALTITNQGDESISSLTATFSATQTVDDAGHEAAVSVLVDGTAADGGDLVDLAEQHSLEPGDSLLLGLELDLVDSPLDDIDPGGDFELVFTVGL